MAWLQVSVATEKDSVESVSDFMLNLGAVSVTFSDAADQPLYEPGPGTTPLWQQTTVTVLFDSRENPTLIQAMIQQNIHPGKLGTWTFENLEDQVWERTWMAHFQPMQFGKRLWVCPIGQNPSAENAVCIALDPGLAFGTGTHPTTSLCLSWLDNRNMDDQLVIDYGCGSGILGIAAILLGARQVYAVDIDPQALTATLDNAIKNQVESKIICCSPDALPQIQADLLLANILSKPLIDLSKQLVQLIRPGGELVLSGILECQIKAIQEAYSRHCLFSNVTILHDWARLRAIKL